MNIKNVLFYFLCLSIIFVYGCKTTETTETVTEETSILDIYGDYIQGEYINKYYGFKMNIPENYIIQDDETKQYVESLGAEFLEGDDGTTLAELSDLQTYHILMGTKYEIGTPEVENLVIQILSENLKYAPGVKSGEDYLWFVKQQLVSGGVELINESEIVAEDINGITFYSYSYTMKIQNSYIDQKWFSRKVGSHALTFALTHTTEDGYNELDNILRTIELLDNSKNMLTE